MSSHRLARSIRARLQFGTCLTALALGAGLIASAAHAEDAAVDPTPVDVSAIIVTAQQREQKLQDVPVPVTSLSGQILETFKVEGFGDLSLYTPGLLVQEQSVQRSGYNLRGLTQDDSSPVAEPVISIFVDGIDTSRQQGSITELIDIDRAEVIRGPQGTLFGRGSVIGVMSITTRRPTDLFEGSITAEAGSLNLKSLSAVLNTPINDKLSFRTAWRVKSRDGDVDNKAIPGGELNGVDTLYGRATLRFKPTDKLTTDLIVTYQEDHPPATQFKSIVLAPAGGDVSPFTPAAQDRPDAGIERYVTGIVSDTQWTLSPELQVRNFVGFRHVDATEKWDGDGTGYAYIIGNQFTKQQQYSDEVRFTWTPSSDFVMTAGGSWFHELVKDRIELGLNEQYVLGSFPSITAPTKAVIATTNLGGRPVTTMTLSSQMRTNDRTSLSTYLNASKTFFQRLTVEGGLRYTHDEAKTSGAAAVRTLDGAAPIAFPYGLFGASGGAFNGKEDTFNVLTPRLALTYKLTPNLNIFAGVAKGARSGLVDVSYGRSGSTAPVWSVVRPEKVINIEAGAKATFRGWYADISAFSYDYTDFQTLDTSQIPSKLMNAGKASGKGVEVSFRGPVTRDLKVIGSYAYTDAKFDEYIDSSGNNLAGNVFRLSPRHKASIALAYERPVAENLVFSARLTEFYQSKVFFNADNKLYESQEGYALTNIGVGLAHADRGWKVEAYVNNLFDQNYLLDLGNTGKSFGLPTAIRGGPRIAGLRITQAW